MMDTLCVPGVFQINFIWQMWWCPRTIIDAVRHSNGEKAANQRVNNNKSGLSKPSDSERRWCQLSPGGTVISSVAPPRECKNNEFSSRPFIRALCFRC